MSNEEFVARYHECLKKLDAAWRDLITKQEKAEKKVMEVSKRNASHVAFSEEDETVWRQARKESDEVLAQTRGDFAKALKEFDEQTSALIAQPRSA